MSDFYTDSVTRSARKPTRCTYCAEPIAKGEDWFIARQMLGDPACSHFEQIRDGDGLLIRYESEAKARRAVAEANGTSWFATDEEAESAISWANGETPKDAPK